MLYICRIAFVACLWQAMVAVQQAAPADLLAGCYWFAMGLLIPIVGWKITRISQKTRAAWFYGWTT